MLAGDFAVLITARRPLVNETKANPGRVATSNGWPPRPDIWLASWCNCGAFATAVVQPGSVRAAAWLDAVPLPRPNRKKPPPAASTATQPTAIVARDRQCARAVTRPGPDGPRPGPDGAGPAARLPGAARPARARWPAGARRRATATGARCRTGTQHAERHLLGGRPARFPRLARAAPRLARAAPAGRRPGCAALPAAPGSSAPQRLPGVSPRPPGAGPVSQARRLTGGGPGHSGRDGGGAERLRRDQRGLVPGRPGRRRAGPPPDSRPHARRSAAANCGQVAYRSAGTLARALARTSSTATGRSGRRLVSVGGSADTWAHMTAMDSSRTNGGWPVSMV